MTDIIKHAVCLLTINADGKILAVSRRSLPGRLASTIRNYSIALVYRTRQHD